MSSSPENPEKPAATTEPSSDATVSPAPTPPARTKGTKPVKKGPIHEVKFVTYPKLLFVWPIILAGFVFYPFAAPHHPISATVAEYEAANARSAAAEPQPASAPAGATEAGTNETGPRNPFLSERLEGIGWAYIWIAVLVLLTLGVDLGRNQTAFWVVLVAAIWVLGMWLQDTKGFTVFANQR